MKLSFSSLLLLLFLYPNFPTSFNVASLLNRCDYNYGYRPIDFRLLDRHRKMKDSEVHWVTVQQITQHFDWTEWRCAYVLECVGVGIAQCLARTVRPGDPGLISSRSERIFTLSSLSRPALRTTQPPVQRVQWVKHGRGVTLTTHPHLVRSVTASLLLFIECVSEHILLWL
jgi:hypothetical protein